MSAVLADHVGAWTIADIEALPDNGDHNRYELLSTGVLTVSPAPGIPHQRVSRRLANLLEQAANAAGADVEVLEAINVELPGGRLTVPDIALVDRAFAATNAVRCPVSAVSAIIEIVSPGSEPQDRMVKPMLYAEAGVDAYWRVELGDSPHIVVTQLQSRNHVSVTVPAGHRTTIEVPFSVTLDPADLVRP